MPHSADSSSSPATSDIFSLSTAPSSTSNAPGAPEATTTLALPQREDSAQPSPAISGFEFPELNGDPAPQLSHADSMDDLHGEMNRPLSPRSDVVVQRGIDADVERHQSNRKRSQWYEDQFAVKSPREAPTVERICKDSPIIAELRTNVIPQDEHGLVTDLSSFFSERFHRPESSVMLVVQHSVCMLLGGTFEPAYRLTISTLPQFVQPVTNKRNAALIQSFMAEVLGVPASRGIIHFKAIADENLAYGGKTVFGRIEQAEEAAGIKRSNTNGRSTRKSFMSDKRKSLMNRAKENDGLQRHASTKTFQSVGSDMREQRSPSMSSPEPMPTLDEARSSPPLNGFTPKSGAGLSVKRETPNGRPISPMKSILKISNQPQQQVTALPVTPPIPEEKPTPKISKRKSFIAIFKR